MIKLTQKFLVLNQYTNVIEEFEDVYLSHPNHPSLYSITDSFTVLGIENVAAEVPKDQLEALPDNFMTLVLKNGSEELVVVEKDETTIVLETEKFIKETLSHAEFKNIWKGIIIAIEPNEQVEVHKGKKNNNLKYAIPLVALIGISFFYNEYNFVSIAFLLSSLIGSCIGAFIIQEEFGISNEMVSKFCSYSENTSCNSVIKSTKNDINKWMNFADLPLVFFVVNTIAILLNPIASMNIIGVLSTLALPIVLYSVWIQKFELKKWCVLCLVTATIIVMQSALYIATTTGDFNALLVRSSFFFYVFSVITLLTAWVALKPILKKNNTLSDSVQKLNRFKRDSKIFSALLKPVTVMNGFDQLQSIQIGTPDLPTVLTLIVSPSCGHCHKAFEDGLNLHLKFPDKISLNILFNVNPNNNGNPYLVIVEKLLQMNRTNPSQVLTAISDWHIKKLTLEEWQLKWKIDHIDSEIKNEIERQYNWSTANDFNYTPVKIINNQLYPQEYELSDAKYFLNDLGKDVELERDVLEEEYVA